MALEGMTAAFLGVANALGRKKESPLEPFKRTLALADKEHKLAAKELRAAMRELVELTAKKEDGDGSKS